MHHETEKGLGWAKIRVGGVLWRRVVKHTMHGAEADDRVGRLGSIKKKVSFREMETADR